MDSIFINGLRVFAYHGVNPEEKENGQTFVIDLTVELDLSVAGQTDDLNDTVSYARIAKTVIACFTAEKYDLLERAAQVVCETVLRQYKKIRAVEITLKKPEAPVKADFGWMGVHLRRERDA
jgi:dihydroneopterin aldolase